jgi:aromatic ring-opening dioxygenase LigB subunit
VPSTVSIGVIAPHGDLVIAEACDDATRSLATDTQRAMALMAGRVTAANPDALVIATPHNVHISGHMAVLTSSELAGQLEEAAIPITLACRVDRELALLSLQAMNDAGVPTVAVSYGGNDPAESVSPMDWGVLIPLWHIARALPDLPVVVVAPAREFDAATHVLAGAAITRAAREGKTRIAFIASADQGHGHQADGPYGFHPESAAFDAQVCDIVKRGALHRHHTRSGEGRCRRLLVADADASRRAGGGWRRFPRRAPCLRGPDLLRHADRGVRTAGMS